MTTLGKNFGENKPDNLIAKAHPEAQTFGITIAKGTGVLKRGTVLALDGTTYSVLASGTTGKANCILADDIDTTDAAGTAVCYRAGHFNRKALIVADGYTMTLADEEALRNGGIYLSDMAD